MIKVLPLGQVGYRLKYSNITMYIDPYLSNSVQEKDSNDLARLVPVAMKPCEIDDANFVLITHAHLDHCDPDSLIPLAESSPNCSFICPSSVSRLLLGWGISEERILTCLNQERVIATDITVFPVPAAHPQIVEDQDGGWESIGFVIEWGGIRIYHAGDTSVDEKIINMINKIGPVNMAFLPVNERNYYRERRGIIGNMSIREAFQMAEDIGARAVVPTHWDMFAANQVYRAEIEAVYQGMKPPFELVFYPDQIPCDPVTC